MERQRTSGVKIKASVNSRRRSAAGKTEGKRIIVDVDYNPREDYALRAFVKKLKQIV